MNKLCLCLCFKVGLGKGIKARFNKDGRGKIISSVCHVNRVIFDVTQAIGKEVPFWMWPTVDTEEGNIDPLRDERVVEVLRKQGMEHCFVEIAPWSFGQEGVEEHKLKNPCGMTINSKGHFIITKRENTRVKVFDRSGQFMDYFSLPVGNADQIRLEVLDVAVDMNDNFYVLVRYELRNLRFESVVYVFEKNRQVHHQFPVKLVDRSESAAMIVDSKRKVVITGIGYQLQGNALNVYENDGKFVRSYGQGLLRYVLDLALASDDCVIVSDGEPYVNMFSEHGDHLSKFKLTFEFFPSLGITFHHSSEHVITAHVAFGRAYLNIHTKDGELVRSRIHVRGIDIFQRGMIVTAEGHVALLSADPGRVVIVC